VTAKRTSSRWARSAAKAVVVIAAAAMVGVASAQQTGTRLGRVIPRTKPELVFNLTAQCFVGRYPKQAAEFLELLPDTPEQERKFNQMSGALDVCLDRPDQFVFEGDELEFRMGRFHRGIGYFMVRKNQAQVPAALPVESGSQPWFRAKLAAPSTTYAGALGSELFGHCVVTRNWPGSRALVLAKTGSSEEKNATKALRADMDACLPVGESLFIDKRVVQHVIGDAMYHIAVAPTMLPVSGT
jgi:hypothetical protein